MKTRTPTGTAFQGPEPGVVGPNNAMANRQRSGSSRGARSRPGQISVFSANLSASSTFTPKERTAFSILVWPSSIRTSRKLPFAL